MLGRLGPSFVAIWGQKHGDNRKTRIPTAHTDLGGVFESWRGLVWRSGALLGRSWWLLGRSWMLLGQSWRLFEGLGSLVKLLDRSWEPFVRF